MNLLDDASMAALLTVVGCLLVMAEVLFPSGGVIALLAASALLGGVYYAYASGGLVAGLGLAMGQVVLAPVILYAAFQVLPHTPMGRVLVGAAPEPGEVAPDDPRRELVGRVGVARSKLLPAGAVEIDGQMIDCVSQGQAIEPGEYVRVVEVRANRVVVRRAPAGERPSFAESASPAVGPGAAAGADPLARPASELGLDDFDFETPPEDPTGPA